MGLFKILRDALKFEAHDHVTVSGNGAIGTEAKYVIHAEGAKKTVEAVRALRKIKNGI